MLWKYSEIGLSKFLDDKECFKNQLDDTLYQGEVCRGKMNDTFEAAYTSCVKDISPINNIKSTGNSSFIF